MDLEGWREIDDLQLPCLTGKCGLVSPRECLWESGAGIKPQWAERGSKEICVSHWRWAERGKDAAAAGDAAGD